MSYYANKVVFVDEDTPTYYHMVRRDGSLMTGYNFTVDGLLSRVLVINETVRFLNSIEDYDTSVYAFRIKDVFDFFHSRLIKTNVDKESRQQLIDMLVPIWNDVKHKEVVARLLRHDARFVSALESKDKLNNYIVYTVPVRQSLSKAEKQRQAIAGKIRQTPVPYKILRPPVHAMRKLNKVVGKLLS